MENNKENIFCIDHNFISHPCPYCEIETQSRLINMSLEEYKKHRAKNSIRKDAHFVQSFGRMLRKPNILRKIIYVDHAGIK